MVHMVLARGDGAGAPRQQRMYGQEQEEHEAQEEQAAREAQEAAREAEAQEEARLSREAQVQEVARGKQGRGQTAEQAAAAKVALEPAGAEEAELSAQQQTSVHQLMDMGYSNVAACRAVRCARGGIMETAWAAELKQGRGGGVVPPPALKQKQQTEIHKM